MADNLTSGLAQFSIRLTQEILQQEEYFLDELLRWNRQINLTSVRNRNEALEKHLLDSLVLLKYLPDAGWLLDMGSGGGLPGIPLAIARPALQVVSVDSVGKKISFQKHIKRKLQLQNFHPQHARLEELSVSVAGAEPFGFVVARAFSSFDVLLFLADQWLLNGGRLLAMKGPEGAEEWRAVENRLGFKLMESACYRLPESGAERQLLILEKVLPDHN